MKLIKFLTLLVVIHYIKQQTSDQNNLVQQPKTEVNNKTQNNQVPIFLNPYQNDQFKDKDAIQNQTIAKLGNKYLLTKEGITLENINELIENHEKIFIVLTGANSVSVSVIKNQNDQNFHIMQTNVILDIDKQTVLPIDKSALLYQKDISLKLKKHFETGVYAEFLIGDDFEFNFNHSYKIQANLSKILKFRLKNFYSQLKDNKNNRIQFIVKTSVRKQALNGQEYLSMKINYNKEEFPDQENYDIQASGNLGLGLIKTLNNKSEFYCKDENCKYNITILTNNIEYIYFYPSIMANQSEINFKNNLNLIEELETNEIVSYTLNVPKIKENWVFRIIPQENSPYVYINPDTKPKDMKKSIFKIEENLKTELIITQQEIQQFGLNCEKIYVSFVGNNSQKPTTFQFFVEKINTDKILPDIKKGLSYVGLASQNEVLQYRLQLHEDEPHLSSVQIMMEAQNGDMEMYLKECIDQPYCKFEQQDLTQYQQYGEESHIRKGENYQQTEQNILTTKSRMLLHVNCLGNGYVTKKEIDYSSTYQKSSYCSFLIVLRVVGTQNKGVNFKIQTKGLEISLPLSVKTSHNLTIQKNENALYYFTIGQGQLNIPRNFKIKVVALSGAVNMYFSNRQTKPNEEDYEQKIEITNNNLLELKSVYQEITFMVPDQNQQYIYMNVQGKQYSILDIYVVPLEQEQYEENIEVENIVKRMVDRENFYRTVDSDVYQSLFYFKPQQEYIQAKKFLIFNNSNIFGLEICVQLNKKQFEFDMPCDLSSKSDSIEIKNENLIELVYSIRKIVKDGELFENFPFEIQTHISSDINLSIIALNEQGKVHTNKVQENGTIIYKINITKVNNDFLMIFQTESPSLRAEIYGNRESHSQLGTLDRMSFGYQELMAHQIKGQFCRSKFCYLYVHVINISETPQEYTLFYTHDSLPIHIPLGKEIFVPASIKTYYFSQLDQNLPASFHFFSDITSLVGYGNVVNKSIINDNNYHEYISEYRFEFKTNIDKTEELVLPLNMTQGINDPIALFLLVPKFDYEFDKQQMQKGLQIFNRQNLVRVTLHQGQEKLNPFKEKNGKLKKGEFNVYSIALTQWESFTIFLSVHSGKMQMFLNQEYEIPTTKKYWKKINSLNGGEIIVDKKQFKPEDKEFTLSVFASENSSFSLNFMPDFENLINLKYQHLTEKTLKKLQTYYFDFYNNKQQFHSIFYAQNSDVEVSVLEYQKLQQEDFLTVIKNEDNYLQKFVFKKGDVPRKKMSEVPLDQNSHYVIRMKPLDNDAKIFFILYDNIKPIKVPVKKEFYFSLDKEDSQIFEIDLANEHEEIDIKCKLIGGHIEYSVSDELDKFKNFKELKETHSGTINFQIPRKNQDIVLFKTIYIKVKSWDLSFFKCQANPKGEFIELQPYQVDLIEISHTDDKYYYFNLEEKDIQSKVHINIYLEENYTKPDLLFSGESNIELSQNEEFFPMPVADFNEKIDNYVRHLEILVSPIKGSYIIKFKPSEDQIYAKIVFSYDNVQIIEPNGFYKYFNSQNSLVKEYSIYLPKGGEFRILPDKCAGISITDTHFINDLENVELHFTDQYAQTYPFIHLNEEKNKNQKEYKNLVMDIKRGLIETPGVLKFSTKLNQQNAENNYSYLITEYRPREKELIIKDYIDLWGDNEEMNSLQYSLKFDDQNDSLKIDILAPKFKEQLLQDYPQLKKLILTYKFYMVKDTGNFYDQFLKCGFSSIEQYTNQKHQIQIILEKNQINSKRDTFTSHLKRNDLKQFINDKYLTILSEIEMVIVEKFEDELNIGLNRKFTRVPFFFMKIENKFLISSYLIYYIIAGLIISILLYFLLRKPKQQTVDSKVDQKYVKQVKEDYQKVVKDEFTNIEMY